MKIHLLPSGRRSLRAAKKIQRKRKARIDQIVDAVHPLHPNFEAHEIRPLVADLLEIIQITK